MKKKQMSIYEHTRDYLDSKKIIPQEPYCVVLDRLLGIDSNLVSSLGKEPEEEPEPSTKDLKDMSVE